MLKSIPFWILQVLHGIPEGLLNRNGIPLERIRGCLKGDLSLVGTRPPTEDEWERWIYVKKGSAT